MIPPFQYMSIYGAGYFNFVTTDPSTGALVNNNTIYESVLPSPNTTWEESDQKNIGFDMELVKRPTEHNSRLL